MNKDRNSFACAVVAELGGPTATARLFKIKPPSVMAWMEKGIPPARMMYLEVAYPQVVSRARKSEDAIDRMKASDDVQPPVGGFSRKTKMAKMVA